MLEILRDTSLWIKNNEKIFYAMVVQVNGSSLRKEGATIAVTEKTMISGSVSAGCMETSVIEAASRGLDSGLGELIAFCERSDDIFESVSPCDGDVFIVTGPLPAVLVEFAEKAVSMEKGFYRIVLLQGDTGKTGRMLLHSPETGQTSGSIDPDFDDAFISEALKGNTGRITLENGYEIFIDKINPPPRIIITGASHIAIALADIAKTTGFHTIIVDPRKVFTKKERFPSADLIISKWPDKAFSEITVSENTAVAVISHDQKIDDPALKLAIESKAFYVGALGSRKTHEARVKRLLSEGLSRKAVDRIHAPIGLKIGSRTPEEIALAIMAEIISEYRKHDHSE